MGPTREVPPSLWPTSSLLWLLCFPYLRPLDSFWPSAPGAHAFGVRHTARTPARFFALDSPLRSTPFDASLYDDDDDDDIGNILGDATPFSSGAHPPLAAPPGTRLVLGLNKYSHDTSLCAADAMTGEVLFAMAKERITRKKHDGGNVASIVEKCLEQLGLDLDSVERVVVNNHHHRVLPLEEDMGAIEWEEGLGINEGTEGGYGDEENLLSAAKRSEMSHHLAHAYSAAAQCPFDSGMVVVMDGMGETYRTMRAATTEGQHTDDNYVSDLIFEGEFQCVPPDIRERSASSVFDWREAESVYVFDKAGGEGLSVRPVFKRFVEERTPPVRYNHGFENMDSMGAIYSRASSHVFGDWNACGKVMGLAPWMGHRWEDDGGGDGLEAEPIEDAIMAGKLYVDGGEEAFRSARTTMKGQPHISRADPDLFDTDGNMRKRYDFDDYNPKEDVAPPTKDAATDAAAVSEEEKEESTHRPSKVALDAISLSSRVQQDLETVAMDFVRHFKEETGQTNLCLAGGVALNSVLNGRMSRELGFEQTFIPPYPGDDGIAVGCCAYGLFGNKGISPPEKKVDLWKAPLSPYLGPMPTEFEIKEAIDDASPWLEVEVVRDNQRRLDMIARELDSSGVVAIYNGRSELGPRALGHRSILADPRKKALVRFINESVKSRESFRPFAPSALAEEATKWFDLGTPGSNASPYMSLTAKVREAKRSVIPAVTHVDGSSRLQTVTPEGEPLYHRLISTFFELTGVPLVLNTSFNTLPGEPIVETPQDAVRSFLHAMGSIEMLVMGDYVVRRKDANVRALMGEVSKEGSMVRPPVMPVRAGAFTLETTTRVGEGGEIEAVTRVRMEGRPMHRDSGAKGGDGGYHELLDDLEAQVLLLCDGSMDVQDMMAEYVNEDEDLYEDESRSQEFQQNLFANIMRRLTRLYEHTLISW